MRRKREISASRGNYSQHAETYFSFTFEHTKMTEVAQPFGLNGNVDIIMENSTGSNLRFSSGLILPPPEIKGLCSNQVYDSQLADTA